MGVSHNPISRHFDYTAYNLKKTPVYYRTWTVTIQSLPSVIAEHPASISPQYHSLAAIWQKSLHIRYSIVFHIKSIPVSLYTYLTYVTE